MIEKLAIAIDSVPILHSIIPQYNSLVSGNKCGFNDVYKRTKEKAMVYGNTLLDGIIYMEQSNDLSVLFTMPDDELSIQNIKWINSRKPTVSLVGTEGERFYSNMYDSVIVYKNGSIRVLINKTMLYMFLALEAERFFQYTAEGIRLLKDTKASRLYIFFIAMMAEGLSSIKLKISDFLNLIGVEPYSNTPQRLNRYVYVPTEIINNKMDLPFVATHKREGDSLTFELLLKKDYEEWKEELECTDKEELLKA